MALFQPWPKLNIPPTEADDISSGEASDGQVLTADGSGGSAWEDAPGGGGSVQDGDIDSESANDGDVLTADGAGGAAWEAPSGGGATEYMLPIWAEENAGLGNNNYEWAFGNGANTPANNGIPIYVPSGYTCRLVAMSLCTNNASGSSVVEAVLNGTPQGATANVTLVSSRSAVNSGLSLSISSGDVLNFRTTTAGTNSGPSTVCAWLKYTET